MTRIWDSSLPSPVVETLQLRMRIPSRPESIEPAVDFLRDQALACGACLAEHAGKLTLALHEAVNNSVIHGNLGISSELKERWDNAFGEALAERAADPVYASRFLEVEMDYDGDRCQWTLTDEGDGFDVESVLTRDPFTEAALLQASGRGILMMRALLDDVRYEAGGRRAVLTWRKVSRKEKRRQPRWPMHKPVQVMPIRDDGSIDWDVAYQAISRNLSEGGIGLLQGQLSTGRRVLLALSAEGVPVYVPAEICHVRPVADGLMEVGCRFQTAQEAGERQGPAEEMIGNLLKQVQRHQEPGHEQRGHQRFVYTGRIQVFDHAGTEVAVGFARDLSRTGLAMITNKPLRLETVVFSLPQGQRLPLRVRAEVVRCVKIMEGFYDVGARFVRLESP